MENNGAATVSGTMGRLEPVGKLFRGAWTIYKAKFSTLAKIILVPIVIMALGLRLMVGHMVPVMIAFGGLIYVVGIITLIFASIALIITVISGTDFAESYRRSPKFFWPMVWVSILGGVMTIGGFVMLIVPGIMIALWFTFSRYLVITENRRGLNALTQSRAYVRGYWWAICGRGILMGISVAVVSGISSAVLSGIFGTSIGSALNLWTWIFVVPFPLIYIYEIYKNLTVLKPELATTQSDASRTFLTASGIIGIFGMILIPIIIIVLIGLTLTRLGSVRYSPGVFTIPSSTASGTYGY